MRMIGKNIKAYVNDMLVNSVKGNLHVVDLREAFQWMRKHNVHLGTTKYAFEVKSGKFLGFMLTKQGIEAT